MTEIGNQGKLIYTLTPDKMPLPKNPYLIDRPLIRYSPYWHVVSDRLRSCGFTKQAKSASETGSNPRFWETRLYPSILDAYILI